MKKKKSREFDPVLGEYVVSFKGQHKCLQELFGEKTITVGEMQERLWNFMQEKQLLTPAFPHRKNAGGPRR